MHQPADRVVGAEVAVGFLVDAIRVLSAQHHARAALVGLEFIERVLELPVLVVERAKLGGEHGVVGEDRRQQAVALLGVGRPGSSSRYSTTLTSSPSRLARWSFWSL